MREILFKAKRTDNWEWVIGLPTVMWGRPYIVPMDDENKAYSYDPETLCQYTGLTDSKFYENDIVKTDHGYIGIIRYGQYSVTHYGFYIEWINGDEALRTDFLYWVSRIKGVGNIFDNPELLKED